ncbi:DUF3152 domain-containing protein [Phytoactinopolyspora mesophila]|uniref:DUF3152 domain-containing protein n=1 Tax=Phytoactinopolyspora mesophila TaxID=2650750 RepID=UPI001C9E3683
MAFREDAPVGSEPITLDNPGAHQPSPDSLDRDSIPSRGTGGDREPITEPTAEVTVSGPTAGGRVQPAPVDSPDSASGHYLVVPGGDAAPERMSGDTVRYLVEVEEGLPFEAEEFAEQVHTILNDERGWGHDGSMRFERVDDSSAAFRVSLSSPDLTDEQCYPLLTRGEVSCWNGSRAIINAQRWGVGAETYGADILSYREYLINHEVGHALGHGHVSCPAAGEPAPTMVQQTKSLQGCAPNPWPAR